MPIDSSPATEHSREEFLPNPDKSRRLALCLSGGGFRAAIFHLGALRRLNETGVLSRVDTISAVSGGSIMAAHLSRRVPSWPANGESLPDWNAVVAEPFRRFVGRNLRTGAIAPRLLPWNWFRADTGVRGLEKGYRDRITDEMLGRLPPRPTYVFCSTDLAFAVNWEFGTDRIGDYKVGYSAPPENWPVARAVAASSCFPPVFNPLPVDLDRGNFTGGGAPEAEIVEALEDLRLSDGGLYDNLGLEPVWKDHEYVLASDGGATFDVESDRGLLNRLFRYTAVQGRQVGALRKRWLISNFLTHQLVGTYWAVSGAAANYDPLDPAAALAYSESLVDEVISAVRTDLDAFSNAEIGVLENHGYLMAAVAIARYTPELVTTDVPLDPPHAAWLDEQEVRRALRDSHRRKKLGRF